MNREKFEQLLYLKMRPVDVELVMDAYDDAERGHGYEDQVRDNGEKYFEHPKRAAVSLMRDFEIFDPDMIVAILLHDTVEDTNMFGSKDEGINIDRDTRTIAAPLSLRVPAVCKKLKP